MFSLYSKQTCPFYTFTTVEGHQIRLTDAHFIVVDRNDTGSTETICAEDVNLAHHLVLLGRTVPLASIQYSQLLGFYSPIRLSGYLTVNNFSTSVYSDVLYAPHDLIHQIAIPFRLYYHVARWLFGRHYHPYSMRSHGELHPLSAFIIGNYQSFKLSFNYYLHLLEIFSSFFIIRTTGRFFSNEY
ncbi:unnamed protein product [Adineta ricciae]|uniref:Hedgehog protein Hint domain-containing protein n=1 Tax=Adineta ricciae TaxID=249248 RepID=A0A814ITD7_ADIRI|nr:unnamed protein product [Adineta ricciae]